jgi:uncharacterized membrane protein YhaH (DUF805 family)
VKIQIFSKLAAYGHVYFSPRRRCRYLASMKQLRVAQMKFGEAVVSGLRNYFNFSGRASRSEFWLFVLFCILVPIVGSVGDLFFFSDLAREGLGPIYAISNLALFVPGLAVSARRLHDIDRTGWWFLITLTTIGNIWLLVWWCGKGQAGRNRFGSDPLATK